MLSRPGSVAAPTAPVASSLWGTNSAGQSVAVSIGANLDLAGNILSAADEFQANVQDFGAVGDGVTDDTAAIQAAVSSMTAGGTLIFPGNGTYLCDQINITNSGFRIVGYGATIKQRVNTNYRLFYITGGSITIEGLKFNGNGSAITALNRGQVEFESCTGGMVEECQFTDTGADGVVMNVSSAQVVFSTFTNLSRGITHNTQNVSATNGIRILANQMSGFRASGANGVGIRLAATPTAQCFGASVCDNYIDGTGILQCMDNFKGMVHCEFSRNTLLWASWGISTSNAKSCVVANNICRGNDSYGIEMASGPLDCVVEGNTIDGKNAAGTAVNAIAILVNSGVSAGLTDAFRCVVSNNTILNGATTTATAIYLQGARDCIVSTNSIYSGYNVHVQLSETTGCIVDHNHLDSPVTTGAHIIVVNSALDNLGLMIQGNRLSGNCAAAISLQMTTYYLRGASILGNTCNSLTASSSALQITNAALVTNLTIQGNASDNPNSLTKAISVLQLGVGGASTVVDQVEMYFCADAGGPYAMQLLSAVGRLGKEILFQKIGGATTVTLTPAGSEKINGAGTQTIIADNSYKRIKSDGANWTIIASGL